MDGRFSKASKEADRFCFALLRRQKKMKMSSIDFELIGRDISSMRWWESRWQSIFVDLGWTPL